MQSDETKTAAQSTKRSVHIVPHTHWDREWYQPFEVFRRKLVQLVDALIAMFDADPSYTHFMLDGQTIVLEDYLAIRPEREAHGARPRSQYVPGTFRNGKALVTPARAPINGSLGHPSG